MTYIHKCWRCQEYVLSKREYAYCSFDGAPYQKRHIEQCEYGSGTVVKHELVGEMRKFTTGD